MEGDHDDERSSDEAGDWHDAMKCPPTAYGAIPSLAAAFVRTCNGIRPEQRFEPDYWSSKRSRSSFNNATLSL
jgi:hypothetical protein